VKDCAGVIVTVGGNMATAPAEALQHRIETVEEITEGPGAGHTARRSRVVTAAAWMARAGDSGAPAKNAADRFAATYREANASGFPPPKFVFMPGGGRPAEPMMTGAGASLLEAVRAMGGPRSPIARAVVQLIGEERSLRETASRLAIADPAVVKGLAIDGLHLLAVHNRIA
jgi:hypothetical protein